MLEKGPEHRTQHLLAAQRRSDKSHWQSTRSEQLIPSLEAGSMPNAALKFIVKGKENVGKPVFKDMPY